MCSEIHAGARDALNDDLGIREGVEDGVLAGQA